MTILYEDMKTIRKKIVYNVILMINIFIFNNQTESSRDFKRRSYLHKWIPENGAMKVSMVKMYSIADVVINAFCSTRKPFDTKTNY